MYFKRLLIDPRPPDESTPSFSSSSRSGSLGGIPEATTASWTLAAEGNEPSPSPSLIIEAAPEDAESAERTSESEEQRIPDSWPSQPSFDDASNDASAGLLLPPSVLDVLTQLSIAGPSASSSARSERSASLSLPFPAASVSASPAQRVNPRPDRHILVCTDSSPASIDALEFAFEHLIRHPQTPEAKPDHLTCLCVLKEPILTADDIYSGVTTVQLQRVVEKRFIGGLKRLLSGLREEYRVRVRMTIKIAWAEETRSAINEIATMLKPTLLVLGSRGLTGSVAGSFLGSVSGYLLHKAPVPVVVARTSSKAKLREEAERVQARLISDQRRSEEDVFIVDDSGKMTPLGNGSADLGWEAGVQRGVLRTGSGEFLLHPPSPASATPTRSQSLSPNLGLPRTGSGSLLGRPLTRPSFFNWISSDSRGASGDFTVGRGASGDITAEEEPRSADAAIGVAPPEVKKRPRGSSFIGSLFGRT